MTALQTALDPLSGRRPLLVGPPDDSPLSRGSQLRAAWRLLLVVCWTLLCIPVQAVLVLLPDRGPLGRGKVWFGGLYHRVLCRIIGLTVRVLGQRADHGPGERDRSVLFLSNHSSWLDIPVLGGALQAPFVSKAEVGQWPGINIVAKLGRTVYVSRARGRTGEEAQEMRSRLNAGVSLVLFPEGTSSDGTRVLPFRSSFLAVAEAAAAVQPVSVVYDRVGGLPATRRDRPLFAWYGDMEIGSHFWRLAGLNGGQVTVVLHEPMDPRAYPNRKLLTAAVERVVAEGAAALRQGRPAKPLPALMKNR
jgi:1-acyl-sn-glycerol-3-phosphate acyltransferase